MDATETMVMHGIPGHHDEPAIKAPPSSQEANVEDFFSSLCTDRSPGFRSDAVEGEWGETGRWGWM